MSATRYYQVLNTLIDSPAALEADPMLVKRLRRLRASRQRARVGPPPRHPARSHGHCSPTPVAHCRAVRGMNGGYAAHRLRARA